MWFSTGVAGFNSENGACLKCTVVGEWDRRGRHMSYPRIHCARRTDNSFRNKVDEDHHKEDTPLIKLPIDLIQDIPIADPLHLLDLGIMRKCLYGWCYGNYNYRMKLSATDVKNMSVMLEECNKSRPKEIHRAIRGLKFLKHWKGTEYRTFLLYLGPVVLKDFLPMDVYEHFLMLSCAVTILMCEKYLKYISVADSLLTNYIQEYINIYGIDSISSNVHNLCHVIEDVNKFGSLPEMSSYPFESFLGHLKCYLRSGHKPLAQIAKRICELSKLESSPKATTQIFPWVKIDDVAITNKAGSNTTYKKIYVNASTMLSSGQKDRWFMTKNCNVVALEYISKSNGKFYIHGRPLKRQDNLFNTPFNSSNLNIVVSDGESNLPQTYDLNDIKCKLFSIKYREKFAFFPLIHTI